MTYKAVWIYISGPYSHGDPVLNIRLAVDAAEQVRRWGLVPVIPHLSHLWHLVSPHEYQFWLDLDIEYLARCDALLRLPGESPGADKEIAAARRLEIPVYHNLTDLFREYIVKPHSRLADGESL